MRHVNLRHAEARTEIRTSCGPLAQEGRDLARALTDEFRDLGIAVDAVVTSALLRAVETAAALEPGSAIPPMHC